MARKFAPKYRYSFENMYDLDVALTFDDIILTPQSSKLQPGECGITTKISDKIQLNTPFISAPMDTVTGFRMAKAMARHGGLGVIYRNKSNAHEQLDQVKAVKRSENWIIRDPVIIEADKPVSYAQELIIDKGYSGLPVFENGECKGFVTMRDLPEFRKATGTVRDIMTPRSKFVTVTPDVTEEEAISRMGEEKVEKLLVFDGEQFEGMIVKKDIRNRRKVYPNGVRDENQSLIAGAAVAPGDHNRVELLVDAGLDVLVIDAANGGHIDVVNFTREIRDSYPTLSIMSGNVATYEGAMDLLDAGADSIRTGIGAGATCTTRMVMGVGMPQLAAIYEVRCAADDFIEENGKKSYVIADGGIRYSGDAIKAIAAGADASMMGNIFSGAKESPGEAYYHQGQLVKDLRGMGSEGAIKDGSLRYGADQKRRILAEGIEGVVRYKGPVQGIIEDYDGALMTAMTKYIGNGKIKDFQWGPTFVRQTLPGLIEGHPHDILSIKEASNYQGRQ